jgi:hypothetical protein
VLRYENKERKDRMKIVVYFSLLLVAACAGVRVDTVLEEKGSLQGKITIGPLCPVAPCKTAPERLARIFEARKVIVYEQRTKIKIATIDLDENGEYAVSLKPGTYIVDVTDGKGNELPLEKPRAAIGNVRFPREISIKTGEKVTINFHIDTGIR